MLLIIAFFKEFKICENEKKTIKKHLQQRMQNISDFLKSCISPLSKQFSKNSEKIFEMHLFLAIKC